MKFTIPSLLFLSAQAQQLFDCGNISYIPIEVSNFDSFTSSPAAPLSIRNCMNTHNSQRSSRGLGGMLWSTSLAASARTYAQLLVSSGRFTHSGGMYGENLYQVFGGSPTCEAAARLWIAERPLYNGVV